MKVTLRNRLAVLMRERKIPSAAEFARRMTEAGHSMSRSHATRFTLDAGRPMDLEFMTAACNVLQCMPNDLFEIDVELAPGESLDPRLTLPRHALLLSTGAAGLDRPTSHLAIPIRAPQAPAEPGTLPSESGAAIGGGNASSALSSQGSGVPIGLLFPSGRKA